MVLRFGGTPVGFETIESESPRTAAQTCSAACPTATRIESLLAQRSIRCRISPQACESIEGSSIARVMTAKEDTVVDQVGLAIDSRGLARLSIPTSC